MLSFVFFSPNFFPTIKQTIRANGKLLLSAEYFVLDGAKALAIPTRLGQIFSFEKKKTDTIHWKSFDEKKMLWFEGIFSLENFRAVQSSDRATADRLSQILAAIQNLQPNFFKKNHGWEIISQLEFPRNWGLGTSSTLIYALAKWAEVDPFVLLEKTFGGSGYDIACAGATSSIFYQIENKQPTWAYCDFSSNFADQLYFIFLGKKQNSRAGIQHYRSIEKPVNLVAQFSAFSNRMFEAKSLAEFENILEAHEALVSSTLHLQKVKNLYFSDYWGQVKSLGAWGGDFVIVTSHRPERDTKQYFQEKGFEVFLKYNEMSRIPTEDK
ncbi:MAG: GYDIA family GHMP kinase [Bacteroidota bacterium]